MLPAVDKPIIGELLSFIKISVHPVNSDEIPFLKNCSKQVMNLPPYISRTPPPLNETEDDEDEEFGTFAVCSDLGEEVCDVFEKTSHVVRSEDNVSEDSGFCMNSVGQTQSPCDISPLSSSYNKGNESLSIDNHGGIVLNSSLKEAETFKVEDMKINDSCCEHNTFIQNFQAFPCSNVYTDSSEQCDMPDFSNTFQNKCFLSESCNVATDEVYFVNNGADIEFMANDVLTDDNISQPNNCNHLLTDNCHEKPLEANDVNWFKNTRQSRLENTFTVIEQSQIFSKNELLSKEYFRVQPENTPYPFENNFAAPQIPVSSNLLYTENSVNYFTNETGSKEEFEIGHGWDSDDEFSDFTGFQLINPYSEIVKHDSKLQYYSEGREMDLEEIKGCIGETLQSAIENNIVWNSLQSFEETPAFKYQWSTSSAQIKFLQALQIDSRNILYGPWNKINKLNWTDVSCSFESCSYNIDCSSTSITTKNKEIVPDAHFDWVTSGLINPLQGTNNEKETMISLEETNVSEMLITRSKDVLNSLPKLNFLKSTYINFK